MTLLSQPLAFGTAVAAEKLRHAFAGSQDSRERQDQPRDDDMIVVCGAVVRRLLFGGIGKTDIPVAKVFDQREFGNKYVRYTDRFAHPHCGVSHAGLPRRLSKSSAHSPRCAMYHSVRRAFRFPNGESFLTEAAA